jgi:hypothetical protein
MEGHPCKGIVQLLMRVKLLFRWPGFHPDKSKGRRYLKSGLAINIKKGIFRQTEEL